ncbi:hypothetical protein OUZ56_004368 [Daphnia magna]|uniref:Uncharacterized protein n=1 Tax=Daphnia magna TaxID=35525 RepID=A0ABQ9YPK2_9CRUS|nr:hypothetical protein OUZ56_004368 [Daphnia magna]
MNGLKDSSRDEERTCYIRVWSVSLYRCGRCRAKTETYRGEANRDGRPNRTIDIDTRSIV